MSWLLRHNWLWSLIAFLIGAAITWILLERRQPAPQVEEPAEEAQTVRQRFSNYDWGGTVSLSNDDSMSLASAQRVLYALSRGVPLEPA